MFSDGLLPLLESGVVDNSRKNIHRGKVVATFVMGSRKLYEFVDDNPLIRMLDVAYVNNIATIRKNRQMVSVNSAIQVDLTGQVCADSFGFRFYSGMGGHADFIRGAALAPEGKPIIALPSTADTPQGRVSRIAPALKEGAGVLTTRGDIHYVVTEHGIAYLHGKSMRERAMALIGIADPDFRQDLLHAAKSRRLVFAHQIIPARGTVYPEELETLVTLETGTDVLFRPIKATDDELVKDLFYSFSEKTRFQRFMRVVKAMPHAQRQVFCNIDYQQEMAILATLEVESTEEALGVGRYMIDEGTKSAEIAVVVRDDWQGRGVGRHLFQRLAEIAKARGIAKFTANVLVGNEAMMNIFRSVGPHMKSHAEKDVIRVEIDLTKMPLPAEAKKEPPKA
jgi:GNAT superfamily N-acetyltransferase